MKKPNNTDSMTLSTEAKKTRFSAHMSIVCDPETKKAVLEFCRQSGISLCQLYDALTKAFLQGVIVKEQLGTQSPTINLNIERSVKRVRRFVSESVSVSPVESRGDSFSDEKDYPLTDPKGGHYRVEGSVVKCALCERAAYAYGNFYADDWHCSQVYLCKEHWKRERNNPILKSGKAVLEGSLIFARVI